MKNIKKIIIISLLIILLFALIGKNVLAIDPDYFHPGKLSYKEAEGFFVKATPIINVLRNIGIIASVLAVAIIGLKTMFSSTVEQQFKFKEMLFPVICGCLMIVGVFSLLKIIASVNTEYVYVKEEVVGGSDDSDIGDVGNPNSKVDQENR